MLQKGIWLGIFIMLFFVFGIGFGEFSYVDTISLNNTVDFPTTLKTVGNIAFINKTLYVIDSGTSKIYGVRNNSIFQRFTSTLPIAFSIGDITNGEDYFYIANGNSLLKASKESGVITKQVVAGLFGELVSVRVYDNKFYLLDKKTSRIYVDSLNGDIIDTISSPGNFDGQLREPLAMEILNGKIYVADSLNKRISVFWLNGSFYTSFGMRDPGKLEYPTGIAVTEDYVFVSDKNQQTVFVYNRTSKNLLDRLSDYGDNLTLFFWPLDIAVDEEAKQLYVVDQSRNSIRVYDYSITPEIINAVAERGNRTATEAQMLKVSNEIEVLDNLGSIASNYGISVESRAKESYDLANEYFAAGDYESARQNALQALLFVADEQLQLRLEVKDKLTSSRENELRVYSSARDNLSYSGLNFSYLDYVECDNKRVTLLNDMKIINAYAMSLECSSKLDSLSSEYSLIYNSKIADLRTVLSEYEVQDSELKKKIGEYSYGVSLYTLETLISTFKNYLSLGKLSDASQLVSSLKSETIALKEQISKEDITRESVVNQIKVKMDLAKEASKDYPDIFNSKLSRFTQLMTDARKNPDAALGEAQQLVESITVEVSYRQQVGAKTMVTTVLTLFAVAVVAVVVYLLFKRR